MAAIARKKRANAILATWEKVSARLLASVPMLSQVTNFIKEIVSTET